MKHIGFHFMVKGIFPKLISIILFFFLCLLAQGIDVPLISAQVSTINLPQTGQTKCYDSTGNEINCSGTGQDGEIRAGVEWPNPRFTVIYCNATGPCANQDSDCDGNASTDVVKDNLTGLVWARNGNLPNGVTNWQGALNYITSLNSGSGLCAYFDWRLPNIRELQSLSNLHEPEIDSWLITKGFIQVSVHYWSSTSEAYNNCPNSPCNAYSFAARGG